MELEKSLAAQEQEEIITPPEEAAKEAAQTAGQESPAAEIAEPSETETSTQAGAAVAPACVVNPEKNEVIHVDGADYKRLCLKTHVITDQDKLIDVVNTYAVPFLEEGDTLFITEKIVACTQRRAIRMKDIHPRPLAKFLCKFVLKTPYGIGLGIPETMEMALRECGTIRILFAAFVSAIGKLIGKRGWFYNIAGYRARSIDGPCDYTLPPYNEYVVLGPEKPDEEAARIAKAIGFPVAVTDINDLEGQILGTSDPSMDRPLLCKILKDNPLGQTNEQTPMGIIRKVG